MQTTPSPAGAASRRPPGKPRRAHWLRRIVAGLLVAVAALALAGAAYQSIATARDRRAYPPPGQLVDVGGYRLHIFCIGEGSPSVILDALFPGTVSNWAWVQPRIARTTRVCAYDRAGLGWSDPGPAARDALQHARELHTLLTRAAIPGPYVLVGHSLGGLSVRMFADQYPHEVAGMALLEASNPDAWKRLGRPEGVGVDHRMLTVAPLLGRIGLFRLGLLPSYSPDPDLPQRQRLELQAFFDTVKSLRTIRDVDASFSAALDQVRDASGVGGKPLLIVLGGRGDGSIQALRDLFAEQAALSTNSKTIVIAGATHAGLVDNRAAAVPTSDAIRDLVQAVRTGMPMASGRFLRPEPPPAPRQAGDAPAACAR
jgi:pimeloyl-ACP methyl ester carboxylesterase